MLENVGLLLLCVLNGKIVVQCVQGDCEKKCGWVM